MVFISLVFFDILLAAVMFTAGKLYGEITCMKTLKEKP
jgi:hypothetical protein